MIKTAVARRYAKALFDLLDQPSIEPANRALHGLGQAFTESAALRHIIASPAFAEQDNDKDGIVTAADAAATAARQLAERQKADRQ